VSTLTAPVRLEILRSFYEMQPEALFPHVRGPLLLAMAGQSWEGAPQNVIQWRRQSVEAVPALRPDAQVRWYESRHDIPLIRPAELAADLDRTAIATAFGSVASWAAHMAAPADREWTLPVHGDGDGWDAKDLLAHVSSTQAALAAVVRAEPAAGGQGQEPFDPDRWNASQLRRRRELAPDALTQEMVAGASGLHAALMDVDLDRPLAAGAFAGLSVRDGLERMLEHQQAHLEELEAGLG
jgi:hypothetical protein